MPTLITPSGVREVVATIAAQRAEMDGYDATRALRRKGYTGAILALTAHAMDTDRERSLEAGMDDHVSKPIDSAEIKAILEKLISPSHCPA